MPRGFGEAQPLVSCAAVARSVAAEPIELAIASSASGNERQLTREAGA
jgi:hypothetical protein